MRRGTLRHRGVSYGGSSVAIGVLGGRIDQIEDDGREDRSAEVGHEINPDVAPGRNPDSGIHRVIDEGGTTWSDEYRFLCKNGNYAYVLDRGQVIRETGGKAVRMVGGMRDLTERNRAEEAAQAFPAELLRAQDEERRSIARELHDSTAQELAVVAMNLGRLEEWIEGRDPWAENLLADSLAVLTQGNRDLRTLAHLLHPPMLEELGLIGALRDYVEGFSARSGIQVELEFTEDFERCSGEIERALFRVVQESLSNVHRHSGSKVVLVKLVRIATSSN